MRDAPDPERLQRLPKWAQRHIATLTDDLARAERRYLDLKNELGARDAGTTPILVRTFDGPDFGLGVDDTVEFTLPTPSPRRDDTVSVCIAHNQPDTLQVSGARRLLLRPYASNHVQIRLED